MAEIVAVSIEVVMIRGWAERQWVCVDVIRVNYHWITIHAVTALRFWNLRAYVLV